VASPGANPARVSQPQEAQNLKQEESERGRREVQEACEVQETRDRVEGGPDRLGRQRKPAPLQAYLTRSVFKVVL